MRRLYAILFLVLLSAGTFAQSPQKMSYQAVIRNSSDQLVNTHAVGMRISILQGTETGAAVYVETQIPTTNTNGLVSIEIGEGTPVSGIFADIDWSAGPYFLKTETDPAGGSFYTITGTSQLLSVPYALYANNINLIKDSRASDLYISDDGILVALPVISVENPYAATPTVIDADGNTYNTVKIGNQVWMAENLSTTKYSEGSSIGTTVPANLDISGEGTPKYQWAYDGNSSNATVYGRLYTWYAVTDSRGICPTGWHVPSDVEWVTLRSYLGGASYSGGRLKEAGTEHWEAPNTDAIDDSKFIALPGGYRGFHDNSFYNLGSEGCWWSSTGTSADYAWMCQLYNDEGYFSCQQEDDEKGYGLSVRCIKD